MLKRLLTHTNTRQQQTLFALSKVSLEGQRLGRVVMAMLQASTWCGVVLLAAAALHYAALSLGVLTHHTKVQPSACVLCMYFWVRAWAWDGVEALAKRRRRGSL